MCYTESMFEYESRGFLHDTDISASEFNRIAYGNSEPPSTFAPILFPDRKGEIVRRRRTRKHTQRLIST